VEKPCFSAVRGSGVLAPTTACTAATNVSRIRHTTKPSPTRSTTRRIRRNPPSATGPPTSRMTLLRGPSSVRPASCCRANSHNSAVTTVGLSRSLGRQCVAWVTCRSVLRGLERQLLYAANANNRPIRAVRPCSSSRSAIQGEADAGQFAAILGLAA